MPRNPYIKLTVNEDAIRTVGGRIVGVWKADDSWQMLVERPQPKPRAATKATRKPRATNAKGAAQPATSFGPPEVQARG
jgi:hypothetical protein